MKTVEEIWNRRLHNHVDLGADQFHGMRSIRGSGKRDLGIVCIGDSHMSGYDWVGPDSSGVVMGVPLDVCPPYDEYWNGTAVGAVVKGNCGINITTGTLNPDITVGDQNLVSYLPQMMRSLRASGKFRKIRLANLGIGGSSTYDWSSEHARSYIVVNAQPNVGDTVTVGTQTYTFADPAVNAFEVTINKTGGAPGILGNAVNLRNAINAEGTGFGAGTTKHTTVMGTNIPSNGYLFLFGIDEGTAGNGIVLSANAGGRVTADGGNLSGGLANAAIWTNGVAKVPAGFGNVDVVLIQLGTNDADRGGWRGIGAQASLQSLFAKVAAQWPSAKIVCATPPVYTAQASYAATVVPAIAAAVAATAGVTATTAMYDLGAGSSHTIIVSGTSAPHCTVYGYSLMAQVHASAILTALGLT